MRFLILSLFLSLTGFLVAQDASVRLKSIKDVRSTSDMKHKLTLELSVVGLDINEQQQIKIEEIAPLVDDTGRKLRQANDFFSAQDFSDESTIKLILSSPARGALTIPEITGSLSYLNPTVENKGLVVVKQPLQQYNRDILAGAYPDVQLYWINEPVADSLAGKRGDDLTRVTAQLKAGGLLSDELDGELNVRGIGGGGTLLSGIAAQLYPSSRKWNKFNGQFLAFDPFDRIISITMTDAEGKDMKRGDISMNNHFIFPFNQPIQDDWVITVVIKNDDSVRKIPFTLQEVKLP